MRNWTKGEVQALGLAATWLVIIGVVSAIAGGIAIAVSWGSFMKYLPFSLLGLLTIVGAAIVASGIRLTIYLNRYQKRTGISQVPFAAGGDAHGKTLP